MVSSHVSTPVAQEVRPVSQAFAGVQTLPATQGEQAPAWQTWSWPQLVPSASVAAPATHAGVPPVHETTPSLHWSGLAGRHEAPPTQTWTHAPPEQTWFAPQGMPSSAFPASPQNGAPDTQVT